MLTDLLVIVGCVAFGCAVLGLAMFVASLLDDEQD